MVSEWVSCPSPSVPFFLRFSIDLFLFEKFLMNFPFCLVSDDLLLPFQWSLTESVNGWVGVCCTHFQHFSNKVIIFPSNNWLFKIAENPLSQFFLLKHQRKKRDCSFHLEKLSRVNFMQRSINILTTKQGPFNPNFPTQKKTCRTRKFLNQLSMMTTWKLKAKVCVLQIVAKKQTCQYF